MKDDGSKRFQFKTLAEIKEDLGGAEHVDDDEF
jgi:hypothetical protein